MYVSIQVNVDIDDVDINCITPLPSPMDHLIFYNSSFWYRLIMRSFGIPDSFGFLQFFLLVKVNDEIRSLYSFIKHHIG